MTVVYITRGFVSGELWQVVAGSVLVAAGTSMAFAVMPVMIMRAVPVTETASANGLNMLCRTVGTSGSSAAVAAAATISAVSVGGISVPSHGALMAMFFVAAAMTVVSSVLVIPMWRMREYAASVDHQHDAVAHGRVIGTCNRPIRGAVVTLLTNQGEQVDWSQADPAGDFTLAFPGSGRYVLVASADGWRSQSTVVDHIGGATIRPVVMAERLTVSGKVLRADCPVNNALVVLSLQAGEVAGSTRSARDGRYVLPLPPNGRYALSAIGGEATTTCDISISRDHHVVDLTLPAAVRGE